MPFKNYERFGEISASEIELEQEIKVRYKNGAYLVVAVLMAVGLFLYVGSVLVNSNIQTTESPWLNRCNHSCQSVVNVAHVERVTSCIGLANLFEEPQKNYPVEWRLLVDDRATYLGCSGFPKTMEEINSVKQAVEETIVLVTDEQLAKKEKMISIINDKQGRFSDSIRESTVQSYVVQSWQSAIRPAEMNIEMNANFLRLPEIKKQQIAGVIWQKWATVFDHRNTNSTVLTLYNTEKEIIGTTTGIQNSLFLK